jgi:hypothetical protein
MRYVRVPFGLTILTLVFSLTACPLPDPDPVYLGTLIISEVGDCAYINISSWLEVYNNSSEPACLSDFTLRTYAWNIGASSFDGIISFSLPPLIIQPGSYALIRGKTDADYANGTRVVYIINSSLQVPNWSYDGSYSGEGFVELLKSGETVDFVRFGSHNNVAPISVSAWNGVGNAPELPAGDDAYYGRSISRDGVMSDTDTALDWTYHDWSTAGGPNDVTDNTDADADGIPDVCEVPGSTFAGLPLYDWGARTGQRDIFIHIDYMNSTDPACTPREEALGKVVDAFAVHGIYIHFDVGTLYAAYNLDNTSHQVPYSTAVGIWSAAGVQSIYSYKNKYMDLAKKQIFHYLLFGYSQNTDGSGGSSGISEIDGNDFICTLGNWGLNISTQADINTLINFQASTIMHEFGHNLGLQHGGNVETNYMPNYYSIMNYMYQLQGLSTIGVNEGDRYYYYRGYVSSSLLTNNYRQSTFIMDYSNGSGGAINESAADESQGLRRTDSTGIDFNWDGDTADTTNIDLNNDSVLGTLSDFDDWSNINLFFQRTWWGNECGAIAEDVLKLAPDPVGDDHQEVIVETLYPWMVK